MFWYDDGKIIDSLIKKKQSQKISNFIYAIPLEIEKKIFGVTHIKHVNYSDYKKKPKKLYLSASIASIKII